MNSRWRSGGAVPDERRLLPQHVRRRGAGSAGSPSEGRGGKSWHHKRANDPNPILRRFTCRSAGSAFKTPSIFRSILAGWRTALGAPVFSFRVTQSGFLSEGFLATSIRGFPGHLKMGLYDQNPAKNRRFTRFCSSSGMFCIKR